MSKKQGRDLFITSLLQAKGERRTVKIGIMLPQEWEKNTIDPIGAYETMTRVAQEAETLGFASGWLFDHFHSTTSPQQAQRAIFECWTSTAALARDTTYLRIGQMVTCNSFRHPALLAKMASTVDVISHGRLDLGIGAGWYEQLDVMSMKFAVLFTSMAL